MHRYRRGGYRTGSAGLGDEVESDVSCAGGPEPKGGDGVPAVGEPTLPELNGVEGNLQGLELEIQQDAALTPQPDKVPDSAPVSDDSLQQELENEQAETEELKTEGEGLTLPQLDAEAGKKVGRESTESAPESEKQPEGGTKPEVEEGAEDGLEISGF